MNNARQSKSSTYFSKVTRSLTSNVICLPAKWYNLISCARCPFSEMPFSYTLWWRGEVARESKPSSRVWSFIVYWNLSSFLYLGFELKSLNIFNTISIVVTLYLFRVWINVLLPSFHYIITISFTASFSFAQFQKPNHTNKASTLHQDNLLPQLSSENRPVYLDKNLRSHSFHLLHNSW